MQGIALCILYNYLSGTLNSVILFLQGQGSSLKKGEKNAENLINEGNSARIKMIKKTAFMMRSRAESVCDYCPEGEVVQMFDCVDL